jgi:hypothetical protein
VRFRVKLIDGLNSARRCTCSYCRMRGAVAVSADVGGITFDTGEEALTVYRFNTGAAQQKNARGQKFARRNFFTQQFFTNNILLTIAWVDQGRATRRKPRSQNWRCSATSIEHLPTRRGVGSQVRPPMQFSLRELVVGILDQGMS